MTIINQLKYFSALTLLFLLTASSIFGQSGDYSIEELQKQYPDRAAVILDHQQIVTIDVNNKTGDLDIFITDKETILYLKDDSKYYTDQSISLSFFFEDLTEIEASVYTPEGKKMKVMSDSYRIVDSAPSSWVFHDDNKEMRFDLPELGVGYKSEISFTKKIKKPQFFEVFHFLSGYPVLNVSVQISYPAGTQMKFFERAMDSYSVDRQTVAGKKGGQTETWTIKNLPAYEIEKGSTDMKNHIPHIVAQIQRYTVDGEEKKLISNVSELHDYFEEFLMSKGDESNRKELNDIVTSITDGIEDPLAKMDTIFRWVQSNIKYIAFEDGINGYVPRSCSSVMKNRYGDCKDMGNLLVEMLTYAGVENAHVAWVGTRDIPYLMSEIASPITCNHVICVVEIPESEQKGHKYYYLDATSADGSYLLPPMNVQEKELLVHLGPGKFDLYGVPAAHAEQNYIRSVIKLKFTDDDSLVGSGVELYGGYERESRGYYLANLKDDDLDDYVKDLTLGGTNRYSLKDYEICGIETKSKDLEIYYDFTVDNIGIQDGSDIIFNPTLFKPRITKFNEEDYKLTRLKSRHRTTDYTYIIDIPEAYKIKHLPDNVHFTHEFFNFDAEFAVVGSQIFVRMIYMYRILEVPTTLFTDWNEFSSQINSATIQNVILEKI